MCHSTSCPCAVALVTGVCDDASMLNSDSATFFSSGIESLGVPFISLLSPHLLTLSLYSSKRISILRTIPLRLPLPLHHLLNPTRRATHTNNHATQNLTFPDIQPNNRIRSLRNRLLDHSINRLIPALIYQRCHALCFAPGAAEAASEVLDERLGVFACGARGAVRGAEDAENAVTGEGGCCGCEDSGCAALEDFCVEVEGGDWCIWREGFGLRMPAGHAVWRNHHG